MKRFDQLVSVTFQGVVVVFGRDLDPSNRTIHFNVMAENTNSGDDNQDWVGFTPVTFTRQVRQVGMNLITLNAVSSTLQPSVERFCVVTDQQYLCVFQQSLRGTLYVHRFRLVKRQSAEDQSVTLYMLEPAWEPRYARSAKEDVPADKADKLDYLDPNGAPFLEPAIELSMIDGVKGGMFDVLLLPIAADSSLAWQFIALDESGTQVRLFNFPASETGLFDITQKSLTDGLRIAPDSTFSVVQGTSGTPLPIVQPPCAATYVKHEKAVQADGSSQGVRRAMRSLITLTVASGSDTASATIDSAVSASGTLAHMQGNLIASNLVPAAFDLRFDGLSSLLLNPGVVVTGSFGFDLLLCAARGGEAVQVLGGEPQSADSHLAPFIRIVDGDKLEVGFGNGTQRVACRTLHKVLFAGVWTQVNIAFSGPGANTFQIKVNGSVAALTPVNTTAGPAATPITRVGAASSGFAGALKTLKIQVAGQLRVSLACEQIDYSVVPPTTPDDAGAGVTVQVFGPRLQASASPVDSDMSGAFYVDGQGLTYYVGLASFIQPKAPSCLFEASDGSLHHYYQGPGNRLSVAQYSTEAARATFTVDWSTNWRPTTAGAMSAAQELGAGRYRGWDSGQWIPVGPRLLASPDTVQSGFLNFVAHRVGTYMNSAKITVEPSAVSRLWCDIVVELPNRLGTETWRGLPRDITALSAIWNGGGSNNPDDMHGLGNTQPYFDYAAKIPAVMVPGRLEGDGCFYLFTSIARLPLPLLSVKVEPGVGDDFVNITVTNAAPARWATSQPLVQVWPQVPANSALLLQVFSGNAPRYDYQAVTSPGSRVYGVPLSEGLQELQAGHVLLFVLDSQARFDLTITDGSAPLLCNVVINDVTLPDVSRRQASFVDTLNGDSDDYAYPTGYLTHLPTTMFAFGNGLNSDVVNHAGALADGAGLAYAQLFRALFQGKAGGAQSLALQATTAAAVLQGAALRMGEATYVLGSSQAFSALVDSPPTDGGVGRLGDTSGFVEGHAPILTPGVNGGWVPPAPRSSLALNTGEARNQHVALRIDRDFSPANRLALDADMTLQAWVWPDEQIDSGYARVLSCNMAGNYAHPDLDLQYMLGVRQLPALVMGVNTFATSSVVFQPPSLTLQIYVYMPASTVSGIVLAVAEVGGSREYLELSVLATGKARVIFRKNMGTLDSAQPLPNGRWSCLTVVADGVPGQSQVTLKLFVDAGTPVTASLANTFEGRLGALVLGSKLGGSLPTRVNGLAFWQRALRNDEVVRSVGFGFPDQDASLGLRWNLTEGTGTRLSNSAASGADHDATLTNPVSSPWDVKGVLREPFVGRNDLIVGTDQLIKGWSHMSMVSRQGYGLALSSNQYGVVSDADAFDVAGNLTVEAFISPADLTRKHVVLEKKGSYSLYINNLGDICLAVQLTTEPDTPAFAHEVKFRLVPGTTSHVVAQVQTGGVKLAANGQQPIDTRYYVLAELFVNGALVHTSRRDDFTDPVSIQQSDASLFVGCSDARSFYYEGLIAHLRVWSRALSAAEILRSAQLRLTPDNLDGLIAGWDFEDIAGPMAADLNGSHPLRLTSNELRVIWPDVARLVLLINGQPAEPKRLELDTVGGYLERQFTMGGVLRGTTLERPYSGRLDELRLFSSTLTAQQIRETMNSPLHGREDTLSAHWDAQAGSGPFLFDASGHGNNGTLAPAATPPRWTNPGGPIQNEAQYVFNVLGESSGFDFAVIDGAPSIVEYGNTQQDAYGTAFSVMKRAYMFPSAYDGTQLRAGYKVSDLETIYVGQVQSKPTLIGFVEGGPPIPSENQTLAFWDNDKGGPARLYDGFCRVAYNQGASTVWTFKGSQGASYSIDTSTKTGGLMKGEVGISVGLGAEATVVGLKAEAKIGTKYGDSRNEHTTMEAESSLTSNRDLITSLTPRGHWEPEQTILNPVVGRRYVPNNDGMALVKSSVADLYMLALKGTQTPVAYQLVANTDIPVDTNILAFPINPNYVKNGTLDGKVGLVNDLNYPEANITRGSYFKPVEAYNTKRTIEKREASLRAFYTQFDPADYDEKEHLNPLRAKVRKNPAYDFAADRNLRSLCNTYVWSADGGVHKEESSVANSYSETFVAGKSFSYAAGPDTKGEFGSPAGGMYVEHDTMVGHTWTMTATKSELSKTAFSLACEVSPTAFLSAPIMSRGPDGKLKFDGYQSSAAPGKVDGYRYMAFLLAPHAENFESFKSIIEPNWLNNSTTAAAAAMREAVSTPSKPWRVLYRTTYVSRVPAPFQPVKDDSHVPKISPPPNLAANRWLVLLIERQLSTFRPTQLQIATAIDAVLGAPGGEAGLLRHLIPWWGTYYAVASVYGNDEFLELAQLRVDLLGYMASKFEADNYPTY